MPKIVILPSMKASHGEIHCPRKGVPFPTIIAAATCIDLNKGNPELCSEHKCERYTDAEKYVQELEKAKAKAESSNQMVYRPRQRKTL